MKKTLAIIVSLSILLASVLTGCAEAPQGGEHPFSSEDLNEELLESVLTGGEEAPPLEEDCLLAYEKLLAEPLPEDLRLTIYYISPDIFTRVATSVESLMTFRDVQKIVVEYDQLKDYTDLLKKLNTSILQPAQGVAYIDARMYYVLETAESGKVLEVVINGFNAPVFVSGGAAEYDPVFLEIVFPFLTEEGREMWTPETYLEP